MPQILSKSRAGAESPDPPSPWLTAAQAARYANLKSTKTVYAAVRAKRLRAARIGGRRELRFLAAWVHEWLEATAEPIEVNRGTTFRVAR
jgi:excisionase family DNA binding protein